MRSMSAAVGLAQGVHIAPALHDDLVFRACGDLGDPARQLADVVASVGAGQGLYLSGDSFGHWAGNPFISVGSGPRSGVSRGTAHDENHRYQKDHNDPQQPETVDEREGRRLADDLRVSEAESFLLGGRIALAEGRRLPEGVALDSRGEPTTDPEAALRGGALLPFGGHKGYALALAVQILTTALTGAAATPRMREDYGYTVIAMRRDILIEKESFDQTLKELIAAVKGARPGKPGQPVMIPGERSAARRREAFQKGIELPQSLYDEIFNQDDS